MEERPRHAVTAGRVGLLVVAVGTAWGAVTAAGGGHGVDAVRVAAPAAVATNPHPAGTAPAPIRATGLKRVSREEVRTVSRLPRQVRTTARRHAPR